MGTNTVPGTGNGDATRLQLVRDITNNPNVVQVACTFTQAADGKSGTWKSTNNQTVTHILVKASTVQQVYAVTPGPSGNWSTECIRNNGGQRPAISGVFCYSTQPVSGNNGTITVLKETETGFGQFGFTIDQISGNDDTNFKLSTSATNNPASSGAYIKPAGKYTISETTTPTGWSLDKIICTGKARAAFDDNVGQKSVTFDLASNENITCTFKNKLPANETGRITIVKKAIGGSGTFNFTGDLGDFSLDATHGAPASFGPVATGVGTYIINEEVPEGWALISRECTTGGALSGERGVKIELRDKDVTCVFTNKNLNEKDNRAEDATKVFIHRRVDNLLTHGPDRARVLRRLDEQEQQVSLKDGGGYEPLKLSGSSGDGQTDMTFSTSLSQMRSAAAAAANQKLGDAGLAFQDSYSGSTQLTMKQRLDVWVEGQITNYDDVTGSINRDGQFKIVYVGMDYALAPGVLVGMLAQFDRTDEKVDNPDLTGTIGGTGWMVGPYAGIKLRENLFFDARAAWGQSSNDISLTDADVGGRTGSFDTDRWLATATLTGNYYFGALRMSPQVGVAYGNEVSDAYLTSLRQQVDSVDVTIGRLTFGPEFGYRSKLENGSTLEPHVSVKGIWNFDGDRLELSTGSVDTDDFRVQVEGGVMIRTPEGYALRAAGSYDGIGDKNLEAWSAKAWLNIPLH